MLAFANATDAARERMLARGFDCKVYAVPVHTSRTANQRHYRLFAISATGNPVDITRDVSMLAGVGDCWDAARGTYFVKGRYGHDDMLQLTQALKAATGNRWKAAAYML